MSAVATHLEDTIRTMDRLKGHIRQLEDWGRIIGQTLGRGGRLLAAGNGGSAAEAQHLTAELVGRYTAERRPLSAICLHGDTSALTAIANDYGFEAAFARQVEAHGRGGDILVALSTSGKSPNVLQAVGRAHSIGMSTLALTGPWPNPVAEQSDACIAIEAPSTATVQEAHLVAVHLLCEAVDTTIAEMDAAGFAGLGVGR